MSDLPLLEIRNLGKRFPARHGREPSPWVIQNLSFSVGAGEFLTIIGPSGAGHKAVGKGPLLDMLGKLTRVIRAVIVIKKRVFHCS